MGLCLKCKTNFMKIVFFALLLSLCSLNSNSQSNQDKLIASCCEDGRGCSGSAYCSACKNCTGCKHCAKNGGSCGVCSSRSAKRKTSSKNIKAYNILNNSKINYEEGDILFVVSNTLNLRKGPSTQYKIIEKLNTSSEVELLKVEGSWLRVKVVTSKTVGYVYAKYLRIE